MHNVPAWLCISLASTPLIAQATFTPIAVVSNVAYATNWVKSSEAAEASDAHVSSFTDSGIEDALAALHFRPPAIPLITGDPFFQLWMRADNTTSVHVSHWYGDERQLVGMIRIDGICYTFLGPASKACPPLQPLSVAVLPTRTTFEMAAPGLAKLTLTLQQSMLTDDPVRLSRPVYSIESRVRSLDGDAHTVDMYLDASAQHVVNKQMTEVVWKEWAAADVAKTMMVGVQIGAAVQKVLGSKGDRVNIDWGYMHMAVPVGGARAVGAGALSRSRAAFASGGSVPPLNDERQPRAAGDSLPGVFAVISGATVPATSPVASAEAEAVETTGTRGGVHAAQHVGSREGSLSAEHVLSHTVTLAYDDVASVDYFGTQLKGLWTQAYGSIQHAMAAAAAEAAEVTRRTAEHDISMLDSLKSKGGAKLAAVGALAYRQTLAATKLVWNSERQRPWSFLKEISTNGDMQTMDVIFPASPLLLYCAPRLLQLLLDPVLSYANNETRIAFSDPYSPHQLGTYPIGDATTAAQEPMPLENSGNMFLMMLAIVQQTAQRQDRTPTPADCEWFYPHYWSLLTGWADELMMRLPYPANQLCTDDFTGRLANNTNLGAKGIIALQAFATMCDIAGAGDTTDCAKYSAAASDYAAVWTELAYSDVGLPHYKMSYNDLPGIKESWSIKYNLLWQRILRLKKPFAYDEIASREVAFYSSKLNTYGFPMDPRHTYVKLDWFTWAGAMGTDKDFLLVVDNIFRYANETVDRNPLTDLYYTDSGRQTFGGFIARPVVGAIFAKILLEY